MLYELHPKHTHVQTRPLPATQKMEGDQRKRSKTTKQTQRKSKKQRVESPETPQPSSGASSQDHDPPRRPHTRIPRTRRGRKVPDATEASPLSSTRKVVGLVKSGDGKKHDEETLKGPRRRRRPVQRGALSDLETTTTLCKPPTTGTVRDKQNEEQAVVKAVEEKELSSVSDPSMRSHSTVATAPESSGATAEAAREEKHGKETQQESKSAAQETQLMHGAAGATDGSDHTPSFKKPAQRKRHKRTGRYGK